MTAPVPLPAGVNACLCSEPKMPTDDEFLALAAWMRQRKYVLSLAHVHTRHRAVGEEKIVLEFTPA